MTSNSENTKQAVDHGRSRKKQKKVTRIPASVYIIYLLAVVLTMTGVTLSGYVSSAQGADVVRVAVMATDVSVTVADRIPGHPGDEDVIPVVISNTEGEDSDQTVCEVSQKYTLRVQPLTTNIPLEYKVYIDENCEKEAISTEGTFEAATPGEAKYWVKVSWPADQNATAYAFEVDGFEIIIDAEQID